MNAEKRGEIMSSKEQKKSEEKTLEETILDVHEAEVSEKSKEEVESVQSEPIVEHTDSKDEKIADLKAQLAETTKNAREEVLRAKAEIYNLRRRTELEIEKAHKFALERFISQLLPVIDSLDRALEIVVKTNPSNTAMIEGIELTLKSMLDVMRKFGVEVIADINVALDPNIHQAIVMVESEKVAAGNILDVVQKGYTLNGRTIRAAMVTVAKAKS